MKYQIFIFFLVITNYVFAQNAGDIIDKFAAPQKHITGLTYDGKHFWAVDRYTDSIYQFEDNGKLISKLEAPGYFCTGMTYDGKYLWISDIDFINTNYEIYSGKIYKLNPENGKIIKILFAPGNYPMDLTFDGKYIWLADKQDRMIYCISPQDATVINSFLSPATSPSGMAYDGKYLWIADNGRNKIYRVEPNTGIVIMTIEAPGLYPWGLTWKDNSLFCTDYQTDTIYRLNIFTDKIYRRQNKISGILEFTSDVINYGPGQLEVLQQNIAIPKNLPNQEILSIDYQPKPTKIKNDKWNQKVAIFTTKQVKPSQRSIKKMRVRVDLYEVYYNIYPEKVGSLDDIPKNIKEKYLIDDEKYQINNSVIQQAVNEAVGNETNPYWIARKIFDYLRQKLYYERVGGWDVAPTVLSRGSGSCSEYSFVYIAMCRAVGIPARFAGSVAIRGHFASYDYIFHRWVEIYLPNYGWIPVDPSGGDRKLPADQTQCFGHLSNHYLITTLGGGNSEYLGWDYNSSTIINTDARTTLRVETIGEWQPIFQK